LRVASRTLARTLDNVELLLLAFSFVRLERGEDLSWWHAPTDVLLRVLYIVLSSAYVCPTVPVVSLHRCCDVSQCLAMFALSTALSSIERVAAKRLQIVLINLWQALDLVLIWLRILLDGPWLSWRHFKVQRLTLRLTLGILGNFGMSWCRVERWLAQVFLNLFDDSIELVFEVGLVQLRCHL